MEDRINFVVRTAFLGFLAYFSESFVDYCEDPEELSERRPETYRGIRQLFEAYENQQ